MILAILALFLWPAEAGELGVRVEGPAAGALWIGQSWEWPGWTASGRAEFGLFPLGFRQASLKLGTEWPPILCELTGFSTGRLDFFVGSLWKFRENLAEIKAFGHAGLKAGWVAINTVPTWISTAWVSFGIERDRFSVELDLSGPGPWTLTLGLRAGDLSLTLFPSVSFELYQGHGPWRVRSAVELWPFIRQTHALVWSAGPRELRVWLSTAGQAGLRLAASGEKEAVSALFVFAGLRMSQVSLEVTRTF